MAAAKASPIPGGHQKGGVAEHLGQGPDGRRHDRYAAGHGLEGRKSEALVTRRVDEHVRTGQQRSDVVDPTQAQHPVADARHRRWLASSSSSPQPGARRCAAPDRRGPRRAGRRPPPGRGSPCAAPPSPGRAGTGLTRRPSRPVGSPDGFNAGRDDPDPAGFDAEVVDDLGRDATRAGVHPGPVVDGPRDQGRVPAGRRCAPFRVTHGGEIPDGYQPGRPKRRRHDEIGPVDDVNRTDHQSTGGRSTRCQARSKAAAGMGRRAGRTRAGSWMQTAPSRAVRP